MPLMSKDRIKIGGLSSPEIPGLRKIYGENRFTSAAEYRVLHILWDIVREPMFILLVMACLLYFILGNNAEGIMMAVALIIVSSISLYQEARSSSALMALKQYTEPKVKVIRDEIEQTVDTTDLVPGDIILLEEGMKVPADARILQSNDLSIDESVITGESLPVEKNATEDKQTLYQGTLINSGKCMAIVTATGNATTLGKIGKSIEGYTSAKTLLQQQVNRFVKKLALFGMAGFFVILVVNYLHYQQWTTSLLFALTLAMSAVPEEIPVAFSSFMALGAYKMAKIGIISRQPQVIENLGSVSVLCLDKTGTITENKMQVKAIYNYEEDLLLDLDNITIAKNDMVLFYAVLASEANPFDSMEKAIWQAYLDKGGHEHEKAEMIHEYPLEGRPPMMTHVYRQNDIILAAAKGGAERILEVCQLNDNDRKKAARHVQELASTGYRVLGVASAIHMPGIFPANQNDFNWQFTGLLALYDPPKKNAGAVLKKIQDAKIDVKLVTGDHPETAINIAKQTGICNPLFFCTGEEVMKMTDGVLQTTAKETSVFARMFPDAKLKLINALKSNGDIVAMTGDGVNDGPALKAADIGIAMGKKGTETAVRAADLVLTDDDLEKIDIAINEGRKIFNNLIKAIRYIISIHIPIILIASLPLLLSWKFPNIFTPIHVIFMELIMAPTCSIFFENEPIEEKILVHGPRSRSANLFTRKQLSVAIIQGLAITTGVLLLYFLFMNKGHTVEETRMIVFTTLILSNVFLTFVNRSLTQTVYFTIRYKNKLAPVLLMISAVFLCLLHFVPEIRNLFQLAPVSSLVFGLCLAVAFISVMWVELYKLALQKRQ